MEYEIAVRYISPVAAPRKELAVEDNQIFSEIVNRFPTSCELLASPLWELLVHLGEWRS